jgi:hypothetical protein
MFFLWRCARGHVMPRPDPRQLDLFSAPIRAPSQAVTQPAEAAVPFRSIDPDDLDDAKLLEAFRTSKLIETGILAEAIVRRQPTGWQDAAMYVWNRFFGFGHDRALPEQRAVLGLVRDLLGRCVLEEILRRGGVPEDLNADLLLAAAACEYPLKADLVRIGLLSRDEALRESALRIAIPSGVEPLELRPLLTDRQIGVRYLAAVVLAEVGDSEVRSSLLLSLKARPSQRGLDALALLMDEDAIIQLGQLARTHPQWVGHIRALIEDSAHPKAPAIVATLPNDA